MGTALRHIVSDIVEELNQSIDDAKVTDVQVAYWTIILGNNLLGKHIKKRSSGAFMTTFPEIPVLEADVPGDNLPRYRKYFDLPACIFDFNDDKGIVYISYSVDEELPDDPAPITQVLFERTTPTQLRRLYNSDNPYLKPDEKSPRWYRSGEKIFLLGVDCIDIDNVEVGLHLTIPPVTEIDLDADFPFPEETIAPLKMQILSMGRFSLQIPKERTNDGDDAIEPGTVPTSKLTSVNEISAE